MRVATKSSPASSGHPMWSEFEIVEILDAGGATSFLNRGPGQQMSMVILFNVGTVGLMQ